ncbi:MAG: restriction endonuclease subunit S [Polaromonas sp.]|uniref:restriction endonuclease subunit S n=1 Tax=Polaromonas sp. TaxID=1869339 RepID=UPI0027336563|nr:restriction endonuclease subunit S [Polaromonas sp.]MDP3798598.1 restriction endonuclease subunit S [Polaromonas sp.]
MTMMALGEAARFINGAAFKPTEWGNDGLPIIRIQNLTRTSEKFNLTTRLVKPELIVESGDLLVSWSATLDVYRWGGPRGLLNQHIFKVLPNPGVDPDYLFFALKNALAELSSKTHGSTMKHVVRGDFESTKVRMPSIDEQRSIVDVLSRAEGIVKLRLEAQRKAAELIPAIFLEMFGDPKWNPKGWPTVALSEVSEVISGVAKGRRLSSDDLVELPYMRVGNVKDGHLDLSEVKTIEIKRSEVKKLRIEPGDLLMTEGGDPDKLGRAALWHGEIDLCVHQNHIFKVRSNRALLSPEYLRSLAGSAYGKAYFLRVAKKTTGIASINKTQLSAFPVVLPPLSMQEIFNRHVQSVESIIAQQDYASDKAKVSFDALLSKAFAER